MPYCLDKTLCFTGRCSVFAILLVCGSLCVYAQAPSASAQGELDPQKESAPTSIPTTKAPTTNSVTDESELKSASSSTPHKPKPVLPQAEVGSATTLEEAQQETEPQPKPALSLLGEEVAPGASKILYWDLESSFADVSAPSSVLVVNGAEAGAVVCLTAAIHGDELNGIEIVRRVVYELDPTKLAGAVIGVPIVNLEGFKRATRYLPDRRDLNRYFPGRANGSYASRIAHSFFQQVVSHCDYLIDIHTGSLDRTNLPQIRANLNDDKVAELAGQMGDIVVLQSNGRAGTLRRAATDAGIPAVTFETGAPNNLQKDAVEQGVKTINAALRSLGLTARSFWQRNREPIYYRSRWIRATEGGILFSKVALGDNVDEGSVLGLLSNPITNKTTEIISSMEGRVIGMALNQIMYPGYAAYHIGLKSSAVEATEPMDETEFDTARAESPAPPSEAKNEEPRAADANAAEVPIEAEPAAEATIEAMELPTVKNP